MGEAVVQIRKVADHLQTLAVQVDTLSVKYELESDRGQELASLFRKIRVLIKTKDMDQRLERLEQFQKEMQDQLQLQMQEQLAKIQQDMMDKVLESQRNMITQLTQLLAGGNDKGKSSIENAEEGDNEGPLYPPGFTPPHVQTKLRYTRANPLSQSGLNSFRLVL
ncbi:hypothetical protein Godav_001052 [Gossypium davidsonii]|uniref:Uncharacterized protein n=1 Tax=Gossypium davidsonii TaxID=34287 RepID=A0A7J8T1P8_GOSDV|nr:hypothetical protein [Gossypium davidsonii]